MKNKTENSKYHKEVCDCDLCMQYYAGYNQALHELEPKRKYWEEKCKKAEDKLSQARHDLLIEVGKILDEWQFKDGIGRNWILVDELKTKLKKLKDV